MESKVQLRNAHNKMKTVEDVVDVHVKKRRAAFGDITNNEVVENANKKKCLKVVEDHVAVHKKTGAVLPLVKADRAPAKSRTAVAEVRPDAAARKMSRGESSLADAVCTVEPMSVVENSLIEISSQESNATTEPSDAEIDDLCDRFDWIDVDKENKDSPFYITDYVNDIFEYYKQRESELSVNMRAILVDWLVEVQQNFELNHETLYFTVKMVDLFLSKQTKPILKDRLQLIGATALSVACKFEERSPPVLDDYLYICDDAYTREDILEMETLLLKTLDFDIGMPLSYTFLRRYAQCGRVSIPTLTLARYMLETSLMDYAYIKCSESRLAAAALLLAMRMNKEGSWDVTMVHYTGYVANDLSELVRQLNTMLNHPINKSLQTVHTKYSHRIFHEVAKISPLTDGQLHELLNSSILYDLQKELHSSS